jgi:type IV secretory pathway TrbF-like protein
MFAWSKPMRTPSLILAAAACMAFAAPAFATATTAAGQSSPQIVRADTSGQTISTDISAQEKKAKKKKKKKGTTSRSSWGG